MLPEHAVSRFLAYRLAGGRFKEWKWIEENMDALEVTIGYAFNRTELYLNTEDEGEPA